MTKEQLKLFIKIPTLYTERLILRRITQSDLYDVFDYGSDPSVSKYLLWSPHIDTTYTRYYLNYLTSKYKKGLFYDWGIEYMGKMIGTCGFSSIDIENNSAEIGYVLNSKFWHMGIACEAAKRVIAFGFDILKLKRISARYLDGNDYSGAVASKCGMTYEGRLKSAILCKGEYRDLHIYAMTDEMYRK